MQQDSRTHPCSTAGVCILPLSVQSTQEKVAVADGLLSTSRSRSCDDSTAALAGTRYGCVRENGYRYHDSLSRSPKSRTGLVESAVFGFPSVSQGALRAQPSQAFVFQSVAQGALRSTSIPTRVRVRSATAPYQRSSSTNLCPHFALYEEHPQQERQHGSPKFSALAAAEAAAVAVQWTVADMAAEAAERAAAVAAVHAQKGPSKPHAGASLDIDAAREEADVQALLVGNLFALASAGLSRPCYAR